MKFGERKLKITLKHDGKRTLKEFPLMGIGSDILFLESLKSDNLETIHTCEANMEDIFIKLTGRNLTGTMVNSSGHADIT